MDLSQRKLTRNEWESIETPVSIEEKQILKMIIDGYENVNIRSNPHQSLFTFLKIEINQDIEYALYQKYFEKSIKETLEKYGKLIKIKLINLEGSALKRLKTADVIRLQNLENNIKQNNSIIFEFLLVDLCNKLLKELYQKKTNYAFYLYTLIQLKKSNIKNINFYIQDYVDKIIVLISKYTKPSNIIENSYDFIEKNKYLLKYEDRCLFSHQQNLFSFCKQNKNVPKLILYTAPTGTGKTLSPIGLSNEYKIIFVCVARHIGLALAKSAVSMEKKVAFAFGCETSSDIRLHYFSALNFTKNKRSGGIGKVDNSEGSKVEIMICDVQSYLTAMYYMMTFNNDTNNIITYWDEPTITMDYENHELHKIIHRNWSENKIPNIILSCATLPKENEIIPVICDFRQKFYNAEIHTITSYDCRKSIPILNKNGYCVLPHTLHSNYSDLLNCITFCENNKTLLRYFDLYEIIRIIEYINNQELMDDDYSIDSYFQLGINDITMNSLKNYYLVLLQHIKDETKWNSIYQHIKSTQLKKYNNQPIKKTKSLDIKTNHNDNTKITRLNSVSTPIHHNELKQKSSGILITTVDAYTLTDGPTIFLCDDVEKIGNFYIQQSNISPASFQNILYKINKNNEIVKKIELLENIIQEKQNKTNDTTIKNQKSNGNKNKDNDDYDSDKLLDEPQQNMDEILNLRKEIRMVSLEPIYIPNTKPHQEIWSPNGEIFNNAFVPNIDEDTTKEIMGLDVDNNLKILLLLGIGMFLQNINIHYMEIMKRLANNQKLYIIIASSDYIYGTNYQFCHGFIGKDLTNMTQQKTLQAMGRIGRNNIQQDYTIRFRDDDMILNLFKTPSINTEALNMCSLFCSHDNDE